MPIDQERQDELTALDTEEQEGRDLTLTQTLAELGKVLAADDRLTAIEEIPDEDWQAASAEGS